MVGFQQPHLLPPRYSDSVLDWDWMVRSNWGQEKAVATGATPVIGEGCLVGLLNHILVQKIFREKGLFKSHEPNQQKVLIFIGDYQK